MKNFFLPVLLLSMSLVACAEETAADASPYLRLNEDLPEVSREAWEILVAMTETVSGASKFALDVEMGHEVLQPNGQRLEFGSHISGTFRRPGEGRVRFDTREGENASIVMDGETVSVFSTRDDRMIYDSAAQPGDINATFNRLTAILGTNDQLRGFFSMNLTERLAGMVTSGQYLGESTIAGVLCDHLALRSESEDVQLWVTKGDRPVPRRLVVTYRDLEGQPRFWAQFESWDFAPKLAGDTFEFSPPDHAERVPLFTD